MKMLSLAAFGAVCDHAETRFRARVAALPDGTWHASEHWDDDCFGPADVTLRLALTIEGDEVTVDFTGTDDQIRGFKNSGWVNTWSAVSMGLVSFFEPDLPRNEGTFRGVTMIAPEGSVVNARPPAPMTMAHVRASLPYQIKSSGGREKTRTTKVASASQPSILKR